MRIIPRCTLAAVLIAAATNPARAQQAAAAPGVTTDLLADIGQVETKFMALARAIPADKCGWRPAPGVRSACDVLRHVASENYMLPAMQGHAVEASIGIRADDYKTAEAFEKRAASRDTTIAELERSFAFLKKSLAATTPSQLSGKITAFGQQMTSQSLWIGTTTHLHEHLGQLIAYARTNGVKPPWTQGM